MSRLRYRGSIFRGGIRDDAATPPPAPVPQTVDYTIPDTISQRTADIVKRLEEQDKARKWALMIAGASALFAAVKVGLIAFSHIKSRVTGQNRSMVTILAQSIVFNAYG